MATTDKTILSTPLIDAINGLPDAVFLVMDDGTIVAANVAADRMFGYSHSQLIGSQVDELMPVRARAYHRKVRTGAVSDRRPRQFTSGRTFECERRDGKVFQADIMLSPTEINGASMTWAMVRDLDKPSAINAGRQQALGTLDAIGHMAASAFDLNADFRAVADFLNDVIPHHRIAVMLITEDDPEVVEVAFLAGDDHPSYRQGQRFPLSNSATGLVVEKGSSVSITQKQARFAPLAVQSGFKDGYIEMFGAPLFDDGEIVGMLATATKNEPGFSKFQRSLLERFANHLSVAVANQRMRDRLEAKTRETESIGEIGKKISSSPDLNGALSATSESIRRLVPYDHLVISSIDLDEGVVTGMFMDGEPLPGVDGSAHHLSDELTQTLRETFAGGKPILHDREMIAALAESQPSMTPYRDAGYQWALVVPLLITQQPVGMVIFGSKDPAAYSEDQIAIAGRIGEQLAGPIANALQLTKSKDEARTNSILAQIGTAVDTSFDLQSGEYTLGPLIRQLVDSDSITLASVTQDGLNLNVMYVDYTGMSPEEGWEVDTVRSWKGTIVERILQTREPVLVNSESWDEFRALFPGASPAQPTNDPKSAIIVPLITNDEVFGFLILRSVKRNAYTEADVAMLVRIGARLTGSVALSELRRRDADLASERAALESIGGLLGSAIDLSDVWAEFAETLSGLLKFDHVSVTGIDKDAGTARVLQDSSTVQGLPSVRSPGEMFPLNGTFAADLASADQGIIFAFDKKERMEERYPGSFSQQAPVLLTSLIGVPIIWGGQVVAALFIHSFDPDDAFGPRELRLAERVAAQITGAVAGSLLREAELALTAERETLARIGSVMGSALDLGEAWEEFTSLFGEIVRFDRVDLVSIDRETQRAKVVADHWSGEPIEGVPSTGDAYQLTGTISEEIVIAGHSRLFDGQSMMRSTQKFEVASQIGDDFPLKSHLAVPLIWGGQVVAILFASQSDVHGYDESDLAVAERVAAQIAGPVAGSLLREAELALTAERETLARIGSDMGAVVDLDEAWPVFCELVADVIEFDRINLVSINHESATATVVCDSWAQRKPAQMSLVGQIYDLAGSGAGRVSEIGRGLVFNFESSDQFKQEFPGGLSNLNTRSAKSNLCLPLIWGGRVVAVLFIDHGEFGKYGEADLALGERIASQIAGPVAGSLLRARDAELAAERETLAEIGSVMGAALDLGKAWPEFADLFSGMMRFHHISLVSVDTDARRVRAEQYWWTTDAARFGRKLGDVYPLDGTLTESLMSTETGVIYSFENSDHWKRDFPGAHPPDVDNPVRSLLAVPLIWGGQLVAALFVHSVEPDAYAQRDLQLAERVATQIAGPVAGSLLRERDNALSRERATLAIIGELMGAASDLSSVFEEFAELVQQLVTFEHMSIHEIDHQRGTVRRMHVLHDREVRDDRVEFPLAGTMAEQVAATRRGLLSNFTSTESVQSQFRGSVSEDDVPPVRSSIMVPLTWGDEVSVAFWMTRDGEDLFTERDLALAERVAAQIAGPVAGALLRARDEAQAKERVTLTGIGELMGGAPDISSVFEEFGDRVQQLVSFDKMSIHEIDDHDGYLRRVHTFRNGTVVHDVLRFPLAGTMAERVAETLRGVLNNFDSVEEARSTYPGLPVEEDIYRSRTSIMVPLVWQGKVTVTLSIGRNGDEFDENDVELLDRVAVQIAGPVAGALARQRDIELVEERQRREAAELEAGVLAELSETKSNFVSAMSHELRTPLTSIVAFSDILSRQGNDLLGKRQLQQVNVIKRNARHLEAMIDELLDLSRMETGHFAIVRSTFDFAAMIVESLESSELQFEAMSQTVKFRMATEVLPINGDRGRLMQVVNNLLNNASKYSPIGTEIEIDVSEDAGRLTVEIRDRGPGILEGRPDELFEMFRRADNELTRSVPGTGIGLHVAKRIIEEHGGGITIASRDGGGTSARFWIPTGVKVLT